MLMRERLLSRKCAAENVLRLHLDQCERNNVPTRSIFLGAAHLSEIYLSYLNPDIALYQTTTQIANSEDELINEVINNRYNLICIANTSVSILDLIKRIRREQIDTPIILLGDGGLEKSARMSGVTHFFDARDINQFMYTVDSYLKPA